MCNSQQSFTKFKDIDEFKEISLDSMYKKLNDFEKRFNELKTVDPQTNENKVLKPKVLDNVGDLFNELYYIYKDKYNEEKDGLNTKNKKNVFTTKNRDLQHESEEEKEKTSKKPDKMGKQPHELKLPKWIKELMPFLFLAFQKLIIHLLIMQKIQML